MTTDYLTKDNCTADVVGPIVDDIKGVIADATVKIKALAGLSIDVVLGVGVFEVLEQNPRDGMVDQGTTVELVVAQAPAPTQTPTTEPTSEPTQTPTETPPPEGDGD